MLSHKSEHITRLHRKRRTSQRDNEKPHHFTSHGQAPKVPFRPSRIPAQNLLDNPSEYTPSQETTSSLFLPQHRYNLRDLPSRRLSTDTSTLNLSALSSNSALRLVRQHAQPLSSETHSSELIPSLYFTSGFETASLLSSDAQTAFLSGNFFSEVVIPTPVPAHSRLPEYYTADHSRPSTPNFVDYLLRVDGITIYDPQNDPQFPSQSQISSFTPTSDFSRVKTRTQNFSCSFRSRKY